MTSVHLNNAFGEIADNAREMRARYVVPHLSGGTYLQDVVISILRKYDFWFSRRQAAQRARLPSCFSHL